MTDEYRHICCQQQQLFEHIQEKKIDVLCFAREFMVSDFCNRQLDPIYTVWQYRDIEDWLDFLEPDCSLDPDVFQKNPVSFNAAGWLGFTYRYLQIETRLTSRKIIEKIPVEKLVVTYPGLHTVDEDMAKDILVKDFHLL